MSNVKRLRQRPPLSVDAGLPVVGEHVACVKLPAGFLLALCTAQPTAWLTTNGLPAGAALKQIMGQPDGSIMLICVHPSFPPRRADGAIAEVGLQIQQIPVQVRQPETALEPEPVAEVIDE